MSIAQKIQVGATAVCVVLILALGWFIFRGWYKYKKQPAVKVEPKAKS